MAALPESKDLLKTPLHALHLDLGARMVPFAGYDMPVQYKRGVMAEHAQTRELAGLFDVSHMGQVRLDGIDHAHVAAALEVLVPGEVAKLGEGRMRYSVLLNEHGGILDDLMISRLPGADGSLMLVVNAACKEEDIAYLQSELPGTVKLTPLPDLALLALQGPEAAEALSVLWPGARDMKFMTAVEAEVSGVPVTVTRSGYTGEDGYEISVPAEHVDSFARRLLQNDHVAPVGLAARDTLRLEAGLCLYGSDLDAKTTPVEGAIEFVIGKRRREEGGFFGADRILSQLEEGAERKRIGIKVEGRAPARAGTPIVNEEDKEIGTVTSGTVSPTMGTPIAMGYVASEYAHTGKAIGLMVRGKKLDAHVASMPFVPHRYHR